MWVFPGLRDLPRIFPTRLAGHALAFPSVTVPRGRGAARERVHGSASGLHRALRPAHCAAGRFLSGRVSPFGGCSSCFPVDATLTHDGALDSFGPWVSSGVGSPFCMCRFLGRHFISIFSILSNHCLFRCAVGIRQVLPSSLSGECLLPDARPGAPKPAGGTPRSSSRPAVSRLPLRVSLKTRLFLLAQRAQRSEPESSSTDVRGDASVRRQSGPRSDVTDVTKSPYAASERTPRLLVSTGGPRTPLS